MLTLPTVPSAQLSASLPQIEGSPPQPAVIAFILFYFVAFYVWWREKGPVFTVHQTWTHVLLTPKATLCSLWLLLLKMSEMEPWALSGQPRTVAGLGGRCGRRQLPPHIN